MRLQVFAADPLASPALESPCPNHGPLTRLTLPENLEVVAEVDLSERDSYAIELPAGEYQVVLLDDARCPYALGESSLSDGGLQPGLSSVDEGKITRRDVLLDWSAQ